MTTIVDGSNGVSFPYGATQNTGAGPAFSAYASADQTVTLGALTKITIDTEKFDTNSNFDTSTNRFTPTVAGYYQVNGCLRGIVVTTLTVIRCDIYKNGATYAQTRITGTLGANTATSAFVSDVIYMNGSTDYLELYGSLSGSGTATFSGGVAGTASSFFSAALVRGA